MRFMRHPALAAVLSLSLAASPGVTWAQEKGSDKDKPKADKSELYQQLNLFGDVLERIRNEYVEPPKEKELIEAAINGMLASLDPHSSYMNAK